MAQIERMTRQELHRELRAKTAGNSSNAWFDLLRVDGKADFPDCAWNEKVMGKDGSVKGLGKPWGLEVKTYWGASSIFIHGSYCFDLHKLQRKIERLTDLLLHLEMKSERAASEVIQFFKGKSGIIRLPPDEKKRRNTVEYAPNGHYGGVSFSTWREEDLEGGHYLERLSKIPLPEELELGQRCNNLSRCFWGRKSLVRMLERLRDDMVYKQLPHADGFAQDIKKLPNLTEVHLGEYMQLWRRVDHDGGHYYHWEPVYDSTMKKQTVEIQET